MRLLRWVVVTAFRSAWAVRDWFDGCRIEAEKGRAARHARRNELGLSLR